MFSMPALGIRFDIDKVISSIYGIECWKVFWRAIDVQKLVGELPITVLLFEGDTMATLQGRENVYCIAVQSINPGIFSDIRAALEQSAEFQKVAAASKFIENDLVVGEPLVDAGQIDSAGNLVGKAFDSRIALDAVREESASLKPDAISPSAKLLSKKKWWQFWQ